MGIAGLLIPAGKYLAIRFGKAVVNVAVFKAAKWSVDQIAETERKSVEPEAYIKHHCTECKCTFTDWDYYAKSYDILDHCPSCGMVDSIKWVEIPRKMADIYTRSSKKNY